MISSRVEGHPPKSQEGQEFNREKSNSKARAAGFDDETDRDLVDEQRQPDRTAAE